MKDCLFGSCSNNCAGYCKRHGKSLTVKQIRKKECLRKECRHFVKNEEHDWWRLREQNKAKRKARKDNINAMVERICAV